MATESNIPNVIVSPEKFQLVVGVNEDCTVELTNVGYQSVLFRILTTARERYFVRHTKGVIRGNSSMQITISLNRKQMMDDAPSDAKVLKDDFRLEFAFLGDDDVVEPRSQNVPQLIKDKKAANPASILRKMLRCHVLLEYEPKSADATNATAAAAVEQTGSTIESIAAAAVRAADGNTNAAGHEIVGGRKMTALEIEKNTLMEQQRRSGSNAVGLVASHRTAIIIGVIVAIIVGYFII